MSQARFQKRMREKARQEKQAAKRARRAERAEEAASKDDDDVEVDADATPAPPPEVVMDRLAALHKQFDDEQITFEEFEERKQELMALLQVD